MRRVKKKYLNIKGFKSFTLKTLPPQKNLWVKDSRGKSPKV